MGRQKNLRSDNILVILVGQIGAGKTEVARRLAEVHHFVHVSAGSVARLVVGAPANTSRLAFQNEFETWLTENGPENFARAILDRFPEACDVVLDGLRVASAYDFLRRGFAGVTHIVHVDCPTRLAFERQAERKRADLEIKDQAEYRAATLHAVEEQARPLIDAASYSITNVGSIEILMSEVDNVATCLRRQHGGPCSRDHTEESGLIG